MEEDSESLASQSCQPPEQNATDADGVATTPSPAAGKNASPGKEKPFEECHDASTSAGEMAHATGQKALEAAADGSGDADQQQKEESIVAVNGAEEECSETVEGVESGVDTHVVQSDLPDAARTGPYASDSSLSGAVRCVCVVRARAGTGVLLRLNSAKNLRAF